MEPLAVQGQGVQFGGDQHGIGGTDLSRWHILEPIFPKDQGGMPTRRDQACAIFEIDGHVIRTPDDGPMHLQHTPEFLLLQHGIIGEHFLALLDVFNALDAIPRDPIRALSYAAHSSAK
jgi:hypothetical protein